MVQQISNSQGKSQVRFPVATVNKLVVVNIKMLQCVARGGAREITVLATGGSGQRARDFSFVS